MRCGSNQNRVAQIVSERVKEVTTPGLGRWKPAWELVADPSDRFMDALFEWERSGSTEDLEAMQVKAEALIAAWREADRAFRTSLRAEIPGAAQPGRPS